MMKRPCGGQSKLQLEWWLVTTRAVNNLVQNSIHSNPKGCTCPVEFAETGRLWGSMASGESAVLTRWGGAESRA